MKKMPNDFERGRLFVACPPASKRKSKSPPEPSRAATSIERSRSVVLFFSTLTSCFFGFFCFCFSLDNNKTKRHLSPESTHTTPPHSKRLRTIVSTRGVCVCVGVCAYWERANDVSGQEEHVRLFQYTSSACCRANFFLVRRGGKPFVSEKTDKTSKLFPINKTHTTPRPR